MLEGALYLPFLKKFVAWPSEFDVHGFASKHGFQVVAGSIVKNGNLVAFIGNYSWEIPFQDSLNEESCYLGCFECGNTLIRDLRVLNAPAENWKELLDCWTCHKESFAVSTQAIGLRPKEGVAFRTSDSLIVKSKNFICAFCNAQIGVFDGADNVNFYISKITLNGRHRTSERVLIDKLKAAKDLHSVHSFQVVDMKGRSFGLKVSSWDSIIFLPEPVRVVVFSRECFNGGEEIRMHEHDFDSILESIERNKTPLGLHYLCR